jgi:hypothetical protein
MKEKEQPIEPVLHDVMNRLGRLIGEALKEATTNSKERYGFCLLMFGLTGEEGMRMNYIANVDREDMLASMKEFIARNEGRYEEPVNFTKKTRKQ